ncbi:MAG: HAMP domain-containing protein [Ignavibacteriae bacterium]|nr:HAMP domain-containing protein [Ignavibacteriota bacterium]NOG97121.1 HAMP domain-containing protein [Ignavibacteriota bacterium]
MKLITLKNKIALGVGMIITVLSLILILNSADSAKKSALKNAKEQLQSIGQSNSNKLKENIEDALESARVLANSFKAIPAQNVKLSRMAANGMLKQVLTENPDYLGIYTLWEPNEFDGLDEEFIGAKAHDNTGRFIPYWVRSGDKVIVEPLLNYESEVYYQLPKTKREEVITDPFLYPIAGVDVLLTSLVVPIIEGGKFSGIVGVDIKLDFLQHLTDEADIFDKTGTVKLISNGGVISGISNQPKKVGKNLKNFNDGSDKVLKYLNTGKPSVEDTDDELVVYLPINIGKTTTPWLMIVDVPKSKIMEEVNAEMWQNIYLGIFITLLALVVVWFTAGRISTPIKKITSAAIDVAKGDLNQNVELKNKDEIGVLAASFNKMVENLKIAIHDAKEKGEMSDKAAQEAERAKEAAQNSQRYLERNATVLLTEMGKFAKGDLTVKVKAENENDDIGKLFAGFNKSVENIRAMINQVLEAVQATASASNQISASTEEMAAGAQEQSSQTTEIASAVEEMAATIVQTTENAGTAAARSKEAGSKAEDGAAKVEETKQGMKDIVASAQGTGTIISSLANRTEQIGEIAQVIDDIADQTNLLALNAAIEAARAGEQGRGFAVVADEVRKLAERTTKATKEIAETIKDIQREAKEADDSMAVAGEAVGKGQELTEEVSVSLNEILEGSQTVVDIISQVASASEEQSAAAEQISRNVESISSVANESASGIQQIARASEDLNRLTENLGELVSQFKLNNNEASEFSVRGNGVLIHE